MESGGILGVVNSGRGDSAFVCGGGGVKVTIEKAKFRYIEHELYHYDQTKNELNELREQLEANVSPAIRELASGAGFVSDPTARQAIKNLTTSAAIACMARTTTAIERALVGLGEDHRALFQLRYRQALPWQKTCNEIPTSERSYFRLRRELVLAVGRELGLVSLAESWQD